MFLNATEIVERLRRGDLVIDPPPDETEVGAISVPIRLGTQFRELPTAPWIEDGIHDLTQPATLRSQVDAHRSLTAELGQRVVLGPHTGLMTTTLEYLQLPQDLAAFVVPQSAYQRFGLLMMPHSVVDPGFSGKLTLLLHNLGTVPFALYPGMQVAFVSFTSIPPSVVFPLKYEGATGPALSETALGSRLERLKARYSEIATTLEGAVPTPPAIPNLLRKALEATGNEKGRALERLAREIFSRIEGLKLLRVNPRLKAEELDLVLRNDISVGFWRVAGSPVVVECKNWSGKVGAREISLLAGNLQSIGPDAKTGILIAPNGVSGDSYADAMLKIRENRQKGRYIIVLDRDALQQIADGARATEVIENKYGEILLI